ncbi:MAG: CPBP family intramembrane metalloprotease [Anaerolineales bacterium]|nr:CPBP family intramembrane metalloprotease [Anaerolineales bacterium]
MPTAVFPPTRPFPRRAFAILVTLYFLGNLAGIPLLRRTHAPIEPVWFWGVATLISAGVIAVSLLLAARISLGAPWLEGRLAKEALPHWLRRGLALTGLLLVVALPISLLANLNVDARTYPLGWELLPASFKAGVVEEVGYRLLLVSLLAWLGGLHWRDENGRPTRAVYWTAVLIAGLLFGWAHVDARLGNPAAAFWDYALIMALNSALGIYFGWLLWRLGLEWAILAHFAFDAAVSLVLIPVYLAESPVAWGVLVASLLIVLVVSGRYLVRSKVGV